MALEDTKKNNGYHSLFIKLFGHVRGPFFSGHGVVSKATRVTAQALYNHRGRKC